MTTVVNVYEAETQLSRLLEQVERGEEVVIARSGRPVARLVPLTTNTAPRRLGQLAGKIWISPGFDDYDREIVGTFEGDGRDGEPSD